MCVCAVKNQVYKECYRVNHSGYLLCPYQSLEENTSLLALAPMHIIIIILQVLGYP